MRNSIELEWFSQFEISPFPHIFAAFDTSRRPKGTIYAFRRNETPNEIELGRKFIYLSFYPWIRQWSWINICSMAVLQFGRMKNLFKKEI